MRIHFTRADLVRTQLADGLDATWELVNSLQALQSRYSRAELRHWRSQTANRLKSAGLGAAVRHRLFPIAPDASYFPDLLTPIEGAHGLGAGIDAIVSTPRPRLAAELERLTPPDRASTGWLDDLRTGRRKALADLSALLLAYHRCALGTARETVAKAVDADLAIRRAAFRTDGVEGLLRSYQPLMRWNFPVLDLPTHPSGRDVHLDGRGLRLIPSYFCRVHPLTIFDGDLPQVVVYPVRHRATTGAAAGAAGKPLARLLGTTRAAVLVAIDDGCGTGELAERVGISPASVSHHVGVLRDSGLITSHRTANSVQHLRSRLGDELVGRHGAYHQ